MKISQTEQMIDDIKRKITLMEWDIPRIEDTELKSVQVFRLNQFKAELDKLMRSKDGLVK